jgi:HPt (histidine-containing phosphotransfer) domain-containing protein
MKGDRERCLESGMDGYLAKPLQVEDLFGVLEQIGPSPLTSPEPAAPAPSGTTGFDPQQALKRVQGDMALLKELAALFLEECPTHLQAIGDAAASSDSSRVQQAAHTLKGAAAVISATEVQTLAQQLEGEAREQQWDAVNETSKKLEEAVNRLRPALQALDT